MLKVREPALPPMVLLLRFRSTVVAVLTVWIVQSPVTSIGLATGAELGVRDAEVLNLPPARWNVPVPSPRVEVPLMVI